MGKRARKGGIANAALRAAGRAMAARDDPAHQVAEAVFVAVRDAPDRGVLAPELHGPVEVAAHMAAPTIVKRMGLDATDEKVVDDVKAYLIAGFASMAYELDAKHFEAWREKWDEREEQAAAARAALARAQQQNASG